MKNIYNISKTVTFLSLTILSFLWNCNKVLAYHVLDESRPPSVFSLCCCIKESSDDARTIYSCKYLEVESCPDNSKQYKVAGEGCPSNLIFTKYAVESSGTNNSLNQ